MTEQLTQAQHDRDTIEALRRTVAALRKENERLRAIITEQVARGVSELTGERIQHAIDISTATER